MVERIVLVLVTLLAGYWGLGSMLSWAARRSWRELSSLGPLLSRVLPLLMITVLFCFYNAEIWQVAAQLSMQRTWAAFAVMGLLGVALAVVNTRDELQRVIHHHHEDLDHDEHPLQRAERFSVLLVSVMVTLIPVTLLAVVVFCFFVAFGQLSVSAETAKQWIGAAPAKFDGPLAPLPITRPLVQVCLMLSAFCSLSFIATAGVDPAYRAAFVEPILDEVRDNLDVRDAYLEARRSEPTP
ncbi:hypothetical protein [Arsenicicoccus sp. oral taxon 190]|uniref:hypothetical protein n=1 Tax=Arsenicicoccus sp. oral taxon 190 TaxID=1658671 RepID=UPI0012E1E4C7|nr:hypothetical protein [Arsenicicoccus sp. oral taxon 190]